MAKRTKTSARRRATIKQLNSKVEALVFQLSRARKNLERTERLPDARSQHTHALAMGT